MGCRVAPVSGGVQLIYALAMLSKNFMGFIYGGKQQPGVLCYLLVGHVTEKLNRFDLAPLH